MVPLNSTGSCRDTEPQSHSVRGCVPTCPYKGAHLRDDGDVSSQVVQS